MIPAVVRSSSRNRAAKLFPRRQFRAEKAFPAAVLGPVECAQGRFWRAAWRSRSRPSGVKPRRFAQFLLPAWTRRGFGTCSSLDVERRALLPSLEAGAIISDG